MGQQHSLTDVRSVWRISSGCLSKSALFTVYKRLSISSQLTAIHPPVTRLSHFLNNAFFTSSPKAIFTFFSVESVLFSVFPSSLQTLSECLCTPTSSGWSDDRCGHGTDVLVDEVCLHTESKSSPIPLCPVSCVCHLDDMKIPFLFFLFGQTALKGLYLSMNSANRVWSLSISCINTVLLPVCMCLPVWVVA